MNQELLEQIGLTKSEIKVYLALLELGSSTTGPLIDKSEATSSKIYEILDRLIHKGLVSYVFKGEIKYFEASPPERLIDYITEKQAIMTKQKEAVQKLIPELEMKREMSSYKQEAKIYRGMKGLETAFYDCLKSGEKGDVWCVYGAQPRSEKVNYFFSRWSKERAERGIRMRILFDEDARGELQTKPEQNPLAEIKFLQKYFSMAAGINLFKDRTIIFPSETEKEPLIIVIDNKQVTDSFKTNFELLWKMAKAK
jgi:HTH-type transcriptional regulator, sugar sensing transcriptional regulator